MELELGIMAATTLPQVLLSIGGHEIFPVIVLFDEVLFIITLVFARISFGIAGLLKNLVERFDLCVFCILMVSARNLVIFLFSFIWRSGSMTFGSHSLFLKGFVVHIKCVYIHYLGAQCEGSSPLLCISYSPTISVMNMLIITSIDFFFSRREAMLFMDDHSQSRVIQI